MKLTVKTLQGVAFPLDAELTDSVRIICCISSIHLCRSCGVTPPTTRDTARKPTGSPF
jgi:hypothetical protein